MRPNPARRVTGLETEFAVVCAPIRQAGAGQTERTVGTDQARHAPDAEQAPRLPSVEEAAAFLFRHRPQGYRGDNLFLTNGGRLYLDIGSHPEYATAECVRVRDLVAQDQAGRELLASMAGEATATLSRQGLRARLHVMANNADSAGNTYGCHESYSVPRRLDEASLLPTLAAFLATRPVLVGTGVALTGTGAARGEGDEADAWGLSPRAPYLHSTSSADTTGERALVNTRDEPHADPAKLRRLHVTCADTTMAEPTAGLRSALTLLLLDALEAGEDFSDLQLADPLATLNALGTSPWGDVPAPTVAGRKLTAVDIQEEFLTRLLARMDATGTPQFLDGAEHLVTGLAPRVIAALRQRDTSGIDTEIDWAIKRRILTALRQRHPQLAGQTLQAQRSRVDLAYHDLDAQTGLWRLLRAQGAMASLCTAGEVERALTRAPSTRAALRGQFVAACLEKSADFSVSWDNLRLDSPPTTPVDLPDPLATSDDRAEALIAKVRAMSHADVKKIDEAGYNGLGVPG
ncbi:MAG: proteasome accessory factor PafA2 family protein [Actinomycetaceae bacterium]|nr:proteasome accessory factor PafA2 family protein [Actinomycetaceae bacterium]